MFADDLLADDKLLDCYDNMEKVFRRIQAAQKFTLSKEFALAADGLVENIPELYKIVSYCRLPYPKTWIEWRHDDRPHWDPEGPHKETTRPVDPTRHQGAPQRVGMLLEQVGEFAGKWKAHLFWSFKHKPTDTESQNNGSLGAIIMDVSKISMASEDPLVSALDGRVGADFGQHLVWTLWQHRPDIADMLYQYAIEDWGGEIRFMVAMLGLLNTRNVAHHEHVDKKAHNVKRVKQGRKPLFSHTVLKIRPQIWQHSDKDGSGSHRDMRLHFVRGHFKHRKSGLFWWSMHARGKAEHGIIEKDYEVLK